MTVCVSRKHLVLILLSLSSPKHQKQVFLNIVNVLSLQQVKILFREETSLFLEALITFTISTGSHTIRIL